MEVFFTDSSKYNNQIFIGDDKNVFVSEARVS